MSSQRIVRKPAAFSLGLCTRLCSLLSLNCLDENYSALGSNVGLGLQGNLALG